MHQVAADPLIGHLLEGRYRIHAFLAVGGMSTVYAGIDERLDRDVAIKVMAPGLSADPVFLDRFAREARSAARMSHVNAVAVYDQGRDGNRVFLVMELVRGRTLRDLLRERGHLSPAEAVSLMEPVLAALAAAHRAGLVHRDVKPENILLSDDGLVKVADFGLARAADGGDPGTAHTGLIMGTVAYSAPEQFRRGRTDKHSDVYSAGIVAFELLTGRQPHVGPDAMTVAYNHVHSDVPPPSSFQPGIAAALDRLISRATARDAQRRPQDAGAFLAQLHDVRRELGLPVLPVPRRPRPDVRSAMRQSATAPGAATAQRRPTNPQPTNPQPTTVQPGKPQPTDPRPDNPALPFRRRSGATAASLGGAPPTSNATVVHDSATTVGAGKVQHTLFAAQPGAGLTAGEQTVREQTVSAQPGSGSSAHLPGSPAGTSPTAPERRRRRRWLRTVIGALVLLLVCAGLVAGSWWYAAGRWSSIPDVSRQSVGQASVALRSQGFEVVVDPPQSDEDVAKGNAIATEPASGARRVHGTVVHLLVSAGPTFYLVPAVQGQSQAAARTVLSALGTHGVTTTYHQSADDTVRQGRVIRTQPVAGAKIRRGAVLTVYIWSGLPMVTLPDVSNTTVDDATTALADLSFPVTRTDVFSDDVSPNVVISQDPAGLTQQRKFTAVTLTVSKGPDLVTVPSVPRGNPLSDTEGKIDAAGLKWRIKPILGGFSGLVIEVRPSGGTRVHRGSTVTLSVV